MRVFLMAAGLLIASAAPAIAQEMPSWAAPQGASEADRPAQAQPPPSDGGPFQCPAVNPNCVDIDPAPVDGGLALLALLGAGYAARRLRHSSNEE